MILSPWHARRFTTDKFTCFSHIRIREIVEIHMRTTRNGSVSKFGEVTEVDVDRPKRVKTDTCP